MREAREVTVLAAGGTIAMAGEDGAVPQLDAEALVAAVPALAAVPGLQARTLGSWPGVHVGAADALAIARAAVAEAAAGRGVVVTHGTDTLEETAVLCDLIHAADPPIVLTGAIRPASASGADGPANLLDAVRAAGAEATAGAGAIVAFAGELHAARAVRKVDSTSPRAFASPRSGPMGRIIEERVDVWGRPYRRPPLPVAHLDARVEIVPAALGSDGAMLDAALVDRRRRDRGRAARRRPRAARVPARVLGGGRAGPGRRLRAAGVGPDPALHLRLRGRRGRRALGGADARAVALPRRGADHADGVPRRGLQPRRHRRGVRAQRSLTVHTQRHRIVTESLHNAGNLKA